MARSVLLILCLACLSAAPPEAPQQKIDFNRDIRPILSDNCFACHGPDEKQRLSKVRLDTKDGLAAVIVPGDAAKSKLHQRIAAEKKAMRMPPPGSLTSLNDKQIALFRRWIEEGARWDTHWSFVTPQQPPLPKVAAAKWPRNAIDYFVLSRLEREGLKPSPEAEKTTLLRRLSYDLTGLPPAPAEIDSFLADRAPDAYEKQVDRLLASPRYGERMAMQWLDLARYADTHGYHIDSHRDMWRWRDWVIDAFNRNLPFDRFTIEQLAGDLLPNPAPGQQIATGFNRNHMINFEGGAIPEEYQNEYVVDRVDTTATVWMAMTMGCARCHDHKYDPIKQKEFYEFAAFFNTIPEKGLDGRAGNAEPVLPLPTAEQRQRLDELTGAIETHEKALPETEVAAAQVEWEKTGAASLPVPSREALAAHYEMDGHFADTSGFYNHGKAVRGELTYAEGQAGRSVVLSGETHVTLGDAGRFDREQPFSVALWIRPGAVREMDLLRKTGAEGRGYELILDAAESIGDLKRGAHLRFRLTHRAPDDGIEIRTRQRITLTGWMHIALLYDGSAKAAGLKLYIDGKPRDVEVVRDALSGSFATDAPLSIGDKVAGKPYKGNLDDLRLYGRLLLAEEIEQIALHWPIRTLLSDAGKRSKDQKERLREYFLTNAASENLRKLHAELKTLKAEKTQLEKAIPSTMIMQEMEEARDTHVLGRGDYRNKGEKVAPGAPSPLPPLPSGAPPNRLGLAQWLVDPSHPLTARVAVNRYWQMYFGFGIVKTAEDFGSQGEAPSHPELLDWLATEFVRTGWDVRAMQRLIVTSATYRQSSEVTPELLERDPENRLLARMSRFRLPAEMVRDNALAASGLLTGDIGGASVFPYQPKGLWEETAYGDIYSAQSYTPGSGKDLYRRSMYTFWKRTSPPPSLMTFDAPDREKCVARRARTNTPLQALVLMNDPTYVEAARVMAQRILLEAGRSSAARITHGFRLATARKPAGKEVQVLQALARKQVAMYRRDPESAQRLLAVGESKPDPKLDPVELAAWTTVASTILNLDEAITKE